MHAEWVYEFGPYRLYVTNRSLMRYSEEVDITAKRFDLLLILVRCRGRILSKEELLDAVWPEVLSVDENNLTNGISVLRTALGDDHKTQKYIKTIHRQGFQFVAEVNESGRPKVIAVLPFKWVRPDKDDDIDLGKFLADEIISKLNTLANVIKGMVIRPPGKTSQFDKEDQDPLIIGHQLVADYVIDGRIRREKNRIRVTIKVINVCENTVWTSALTKSNMDVLDLGEAVAEQVSTHITGLSLNSEDRAQIRERFTSNPRAEEKYRKGVGERNKFTAEGWKKAIQSLKRAVSLDPHFAKAWAAIADCYLLMGLHGLLPPNEILTKVKEAAKEAINIDDSLAGAHTSLAFTKMHGDWDWDGAEKEFKRAIELNPNNATAHQIYAHLLTAKGRFHEAIDEIGRAFLIDTPPLPILGVVKAIIFYEAKRFRRSIEECEKIIMAYPTFDPAYYCLAIALVEEGRFQEAKAAAQITVTFTHHHQMKLALQGYVYAKAGEKEEAQHVLNELNKRRKDMQQYVSALHLAFIYAALGDKDLAFNCLFEAREQKDEFLFLSRVETRLDSLHDDARFTELLLSIGLPPLDDSE